MRPNSRSKPHIPIDDISEEEIEKDINYLKSGIHGVVEPRDQWTSTDALADRLDGELAATFDNGERLEDVPDYIKNTSGDDNDVVYDDNYETYLGKSAETRFAKGKDADTGVDDEYEKLKAISSRLDKEKADERSQRPGDLDKSRSKKLGQQPFREGWRGKVNKNDRNRESLRLSHGNVGSGFKSSHELSGYKAGKFKMGDDKPLHPADEPAVSGSKSAPHLDSGRVRSGSEGPPHLEDALVGSDSKSSESVAALIETSVKKQIDRLFDELLVKKMKMAGGTSPRLGDERVGSGSNPLAEGGENEGMGPGTAAKLTIHGISTRGNGTKLLKAITDTGVEQTTKIGNSAKPTRPQLNLGALPFVKTTTARTLQVNNDMQGFDGDSIEMLSNWSTSSHAINKTIISGQGHGKSDYFSSLHGRQGVIFASSVVACVAVLFLAVITYQIVARVKRNRKSKAQYMPVSSDETIGPVERPRDRSHPSERKKKMGKKKFSHEKLETVDQLPPYQNLSPVFETDDEEEDSEYDDEEDTLFIKGQQRARKK
ncbi:hypothetical protein Btru_025642 [Bulinus truncatus]|nr:hypothetical protein Btru_025642 [Bulinus truncatus]